MALKANSQNARVLRVLSDGRWHTTANIVRKSGASRLNSRVSELRNHGYVIEREKVSGEKESLRHRYRCANPPTAATIEALVDMVIPGQAIAPRNMENRYRIYKQVFDELELLATATTPGDVGVALVTLGSEGEFAESCVGLLDTHGKENALGTWLINPFDMVPL